jgi:hypothetical protein
MAGCWESELCAGLAFSHATIDPANSMRRSSSTAWTRFVMRAAPPMLALLLIAACNDEDKTSKEKADTKDAAVEALKADQQMVQDPVRTGVELEGRLRRAVSLQNGLLIIHNPYEAGLTMHVLPPAAPRMLSCGLVGVSVVFGTSVTGDRDSVQHELELVLTPAGVAPNVCETLAPRLGRVLLQYSD